MSPVPKNAVTKITNNCTNEECKVLDYYYEPSDKLEAIRNLLLKVKDIIQNSNSVFDLINKIIPVRSTKDRVIA